MITFGFLINTHGLKWQKIVSQFKYLGKTLLVRGWGIFGSAGWGAITSLLLLGHFWHCSRHRAMPGTKQGLVTSKTYIHLNSYTISLV